MNNEFEAGSAVAPPKKSKLIWILPIGCLGILLVCGLGAGVVYYVFGGAITGAIEQISVGVDTIENSSEVQAKLGTPVTCEPTGEQTKQQDGSNIEMTFGMSVSGPKGSGTGEVVSFFDGETFEWSTKSISVTIDGETMNLTDDSDFSLDIDDMGEGESDSADDAK